MRKSSPFQVTCRSLSHSNGWGTAGLCSLISRDLLQRAHCQCYSELTMLQTCHWVDDRHISFHGNHRKLTTTIQLVSSGDIFSNLIVTVTEKIHSLTHSLLRVTGCGSQRPPCRPIFSNSPCVISRESGVPHNLAHPCGPWPASWAIPAVVWCVSWSGIHGSFRVMCAGVRSARQRMWRKMEWWRAAMVLRMLGWFVLSDTALLVMKSFHRMSRMRLWHVMWNACSLREPSFKRVDVSAPWRPTARTHVDPQLRSKTQPILTPDSV